MMVEKYQGSHSSSNLTDGEIRRLVKELKEAYQKIPYVKEKAEEVAQKEHDEAEEKLDKALDNLPDQ